ncbi:hypothetical protein EYF80_031976 [Liparis tanakae]|uniref:Uncharacterized protein n=1 Tax=Liparis tanakae TaxID=230148 RepID=A0A4Z2GYR2_9TELE|nr:hypothetical protein EYF80_031976 [Liparis tanakae]
MGHLAGHAPHWSVLLDGGIDYVLCCKQAVEHSAGKASSSPSASRWSCVSTPEVQLLLLRPQRTTEQEGAGRR